MENQVKFHQILQKLVPLTLLCLLLAFQGFAQQAAPSLSPDAFEAAAKKKKKAVILDIRTPQEVESGYIADADFIDFLAENFEEELKSLDKKKTYYVYCRSAKRTIPATEKMKELGFKKVYMLEGGLNNWVSSGKEIVTKQE
ncbi:rhodanese-like domain-containing protein [Mongoliitalea daihaiensis]|uniref:rhodanese-like domain-containing protein n=1 Tax=Mongoliitalea daihaiensis TaxID=2782006 RepID=UPI001F2882D7|nr:rhodanese-like domain-containing protein [Mongoliitalea daihaiensis]UJP64850.1 rhodanese-like domain-containing protein [Mongoliitalea daihaiensis]